MRKLVLIVFVLVAVVSLFAEEGEKKVVVGGRIMVEMLSENNLDFVEFEEATDTVPAYGNDLKVFGKARVDFFVKGIINKFAFAKFSTRLEGADGSKYIRFGSDKESGYYDDYNDEWISTTTNQLNDAMFKTQEAFVGLTNFKNFPVDINIGRKYYQYGTSNIIDNKLYGININAKFKGFFLNLNHHILEYHGALDTVEDYQNTSLLGLTFGQKNINGLGGAYAYFWLKGKNVLDYTDNKKTVLNSLSVFGLRYDGLLMNGMLKPYLEFALSGGSNGQDGDSESTVSGSLLDLGVVYDHNIPAGTIDAGFEFAVASGNDAKTDDEYEGFVGVQNGFREVGYSALRLDQGGIQMIQFGLGFTPTARKELRVGFTFHSFTDATENYKTEADKDLSGENMFNEIGLNSSCKIAKNSKLYFGWAMIMPNEDYQGEGRKTAGNAFWLGSQVKF